MSLPVSGAFHTPYMAPARDRLREAIAAADVRDTEIPIVSNVDALAHDQGEEWTALLSAQLSSPVRWKHCLLDAGGARRHRVRRARPGRRAHRHGQALVEGSRTISVATPEDLDKLLEWVGATVARAGRRRRGRAPVRRRAPRRQPGGRDLHAGRRSAPVAVIEVGTVLGHVGEHEVRSPFDGVLQSYIAVDTERVMPRQPIAWLRTS